MNEARALRIVRAGLLARCAVRQGAYIGTDGPPGSEWGWNQLVRFKGAFTLVILQPTTDLPFFLEGVGMTRCYHVDTWTADGGFRVAFGRAGLDLAECLARGLARTGQPMSVLPKMGDPKRSEAALQFLVDLYRGEAR